MTTPVTCTVCIANYNGEDLLDTCLASVFAQEWPGSVQVIVHDDASTDRSLDVLATWPDVELIASDANVGFCIANNRMVAASRGQFVLLLNNDAALMPGALATLLAEAVQPFLDRTLPQRRLLELGDVARVQAAG